eukprot:360685-Chlamydomonas_euryale.AAC.13
MHKWGVRVRPVILLPAQFSGPGKPVRALTCCRRAEHPSCAGRKQGSRRWPGGCPRAAQAAAGFSRCGAARITGATPPCHTWQRGAVVLPGPRA